MTHTASNAAARLSFSFRTARRHSHTAPSTKASAHTVPTKPVSAMVCSRWLWAYLDSYWKDWTERVTFSVEPRPRPKMGAVEKIFHASLSNSNRRVKLLLFSRLFPNSRDEIASGSQG